MPNILRRFSTEELLTELIRRERHQKGWEPLKMDQCPAISVLEERLQPLGVHIVRTIESKRLRVWLQANEARVLGSPLLLGEKFFQDKAVRVENDPVEGRVYSCERNHTGSPQWTVAELHKAKAALYFFVQINTRCVWFATRAELVEVKKRVEAGETWPGFNIHKGREGSMRVWARSDTVMELERRVYDTCGKLVCNVDTGGD